MALEEDNVPFLARLVRRVGAEGASGREVSILALSAASFGARQPPDTTPPTGFDPAAVALFEGLVECAFLVANADGVFDEEEREAFERLVVVACGGVVSPRQIGALVDDLSAQLEEDGEDARLRAATAAFKRRAHAEEALRVSVVMAQASDGVSPAERDMIQRIAAACGLEAADVDAAYAAVAAEVASAAAR